MVPSNSVQSVQTLRPVLVSQHVLSLNKENVFPQ